MTAETVRQLPYLSWKNEWAWMETMRGKRWDALLQQEHAHHHRLLQHPRVNALLQPMEQELADSQRLLYVPGFQAGRGLLHITVTPESQFQWCWNTDIERGKSKGKGKSKLRKASDLDVDADVSSDHVWIVTETDEPYVNRLCCEDRDGQVLWQKTQLSAEVAVIAPYVYFIRTPKDMRTTGLYACDALTGRNERCIYKEKNPEHYLGLVKGSGRTLYLVSEDAGGSQSYHVDGLHVRPLFPHSVSQLLLGRVEKQGAHCALLRRTRYGPWEAHGLTNWNLPPSGSYDDIEWINLTTGHVLTLQEGSETLWYCSPHALHAPPKPLLTLKAGTFFYYAWEAWENRPHQRFMVQSPFSPPFLLHAYQDKLVRAPIAKQKPHTWLSEPLTVHKWHTTSADGTIVPYVVVYQKGPRPPKAQLVYVYGAYGSTTPVQWPHAYWSPLLRRGWAIVYAYVRGGGDRTEEWADQARRAYRHRSVDDLDAVLRDAQQRLHLSPQKTVLYGRSAGGVPVGALLARYPKGERVGFVFTEAPYVDVLRTSTNPTLPLTVGEYKEFGDPGHHPEEFHELLHVSPINSLPAEGAPGVFVLTRVGLRDKQVLAYESFKWIQRLRGHVTPASLPASLTQPKYITFARDQEHVYRAAMFPHYRAMDLAVLEAWVEGALRAVPAR